uniref:Placental growth factor n=1 Tax=Zosterops lateralis melanops TaxID=1220523 RepID=A0A8D2PM49_ZOSLA
RQSLLGWCVSPAQRCAQCADGLTVLTFREIWNRSFCRPLEQLVDVITEFPNEVEYIFRPSCVSLQRCGGCCGDEGLRCVPVETSTVTMQVRLPKHRSPSMGRILLLCAGWKCQTLLQGLVWITPMNIPCKALGCPA